MKKFGIPWNLFHISMDSLLFLNMPFYSFSGYLEVTFVIGFLSGMWLHRVLFCLKQNSLHYDN